MGEGEIIAVGKELFARARRAPSSDGIIDRTMMRWTMADELLKAQLFRLVDVLPVLKDAAPINRHLREYLASVADRLPWVAREGLNFIGQSGPLANMLAFATRFGATRMARRFIAAADENEAIAAARRLRKQNLTFTVDLLGEAVLSAGEARAYQAYYLRLIEQLANEAAEWRENALIDRDHRGAIPKVNVSVKLSSLFSQFDPIDPEGTSRAVRERLRPILRLAKERGVFINVDMEQFSYKDTTLRIFRDVLEEDEFRAWGDVGIAIQAYLQSSGEDLRRLAEWATARGTGVWVRLVKGAYWEYENIIAQQNNWPLPVYPTKPQTDANYEAQTAFLMQNYQVLRPAIASHNIRSIAAALALAKEHGVPEKAFEFQLLYGMGEEIKAALVSMGQRVRVYAPVGALLPGMAYLVRRLLENTSNESFLRAGFIEHVSEEALLMNPLKKMNHELTRMDTNKKTPIRDHSCSFVVDSFLNEALTDFSCASAREAMKGALELVRGEMGKSYALVIGGERVETGEWIASVDPSLPSRVVGRVAGARVAEVERAVAVAKGAFAAWRDTSVEVRAGVLFRLAEVLRRRRFEMAAWQVFEVGKPWREADADVAEAIDYCEFYAREALRLGRGWNCNVPGEENRNLYEPRGVAVTIAPWNFPLAILLGMSVSALVTGNTVIMKPAEQSSVIGAKLMEALEEAGAPAGTVNLLTGVGETIGPALVGHRDVAMIAFTGSRAVGLAIQQEAAKVSGGQEHLKRVITELGGKNAIIIDDDADLDEAVHGVVASAFGYAGQKCSACSRVIVPEAIHDTFVSRLVEATASLKQGPAEDPSNFLGPVVDRDAYERIVRTIQNATAKRVHPLATDNWQPATDGGFFVPPTIFINVPPDSPLAQEEIFGPVLSVIRSRDLGDSIAIANGTKYALTGGLFSRSPATIERVRREFRVGNLYINRKITGANVLRQPFGGFKLSGTGPKAGGPDYLLHFMHQRTITENTMRRGFAPPES